MSAAVLSIGTEITRGEIVDTNSTWLAAQLTELGFDVTELASVDDNRARVVCMLSRLAAAHDVVVCTGGLGPTSDDLTTECVALASGLPLTRDDRSVRVIQERFARLGRTMFASNVKQADFPAGATVLPNAVGTAPGFALRIRRAWVWFFPGVPLEMRTIFAEHAVPLLRALARPRTHQIRIRTFGKPESAVAELLAGLEERFAGLTIGYRASFPEVEVKIAVRGVDMDRARAIAQDAADQAIQRLGPIVFGLGDQTFVGAVASTFRNRGCRLAVAESCTGGLVAQMLTSEPASDYLVAALVTYANEAKTALLGVPESLLSAHGAVSQAVAEEMARGAARVSGADVGLGITGIAGPSGGTEDKPIGLVHWAVVHPRGIASRHRIFPGDRKRVQRLAAYAALALARECVQEV